MKANEAKSKFVYPDKLYARCKDNKTLDISYAPQNMDAVEYTRTDAIIEKARKWFEECFMNVHKWEISTYEFENIQSMIDEFRKYMKGQ